MGKEVREKVAHKFTQLGMPKSSRGQGILNMKHSSEKQSQVFFMSVGK